MTTFGDLTTDEHGLVPTVVQHATTGQVLMVAWMSEAAFEATLQTGKVHFWSRRRQELWRKGATSGNVLRLVAIAPDCDGDVLLVQADPAGPACHTGSVSCFDVEPPTVGELGRLWDTIQQRLRERPEGSYTTALVAEGIDGPARKVHEEAGELVFAAKDHAAGAGDPSRVVEEAADLIYHLWVLLAERGIALGDVTAELARRS